MCRLVDPPRQASPSGHQETSLHPHPSCYQAGAGDCARPRGPRGMAQRCPSHTMAPSWSSAIHIIWGGKLGCTPVARAGKRGRSGDWEEQSLSALSVFSEHRAPFSLHPTSLPSGVTLATDAEPASQLVSHRTHYCSVGRKSWIDESLCSVQLQG